MKFGYALYSARDQYQDQESLFRILQALAEMGYEGVEFYGYAGVPAGALAAELARCGLRGLSTHLPLERWQAGFQAEIEYAARAGVAYITFPWLAPEMRTTSVYKKLIEGFPRIAERCAGYGLRFQYHSHDWEFKRDGQGYVMDRLLASSADFTYELDTFWAQYAGVDAAEYLRRYSDRIDMFHIKDCLQLEKEPLFCAIGEGKMDNARILQTAVRLEKEWAIVELDCGRRDPLEDAAISANNLSRLMKQLR